ncbi:MAG: ribosome small subunit-dependent GTPase A [Armatimonadetes bacterium]|nr:ribosome small subunit-dependent GTPase A [Anaerolineae bacterium]
MHSGLVIKDQSGFFWVEVADGAVYRCRLRGRLLEQAQSSDIAAIGDQVQFSVVEGDEEGLKGWIEAVDERASVLSRAVRTEGNRGGGEAQREQVIIANAEQALLVLAAAQPSPDVLFLDRLLVIGEKSGIERLLIVVNKVDLEDPSTILARFSPYEKMGYEVLYTSALTGTGILELRKLLRGKLSALTGPSGVGKTSLLNQIEPGLGRAVKAVSGYNQEGTHTTRDSALVKLAFGGYLADTPGVRYLNIWDIEPEELDAYYRDIAPFVSKCKFGDCTHENEPGCAVRQAVKDGAVTKLRYKSYRTLRAELEALYAYD